MKIVLFVLFDYQIFYSMKVFIRPRTSEYCPLIGLGDYLLIIGTKPISYLFEYLNPSCMSCKYV